jgi:hypothetical protein
VTDDESWPMIEEAVLRLFAELAGKTGSDAHVAVGPRLAELGWDDIEAEYPVEACELLFRAQGRTLAHTDCLDRTMLAELGGLLDEPADRILLPDPSAGFTPGTDSEHVTGVVLGPLEGRLVVPVSGQAGRVSVAVVDASTLRGERLDTFDTSAFWTRVSGRLDPATLVEASAEWELARAAAYRGLATELVALAERALSLAVDHVSVRVQFGSAIGSFQSPRHALADAAAVVAGARALLGESWRYGGRLSALTAKAAAGRAHRVVSDVALQVCGAIGLTVEHDLHRYVTRGFQVDALCGSYSQIEAALGERLFELYEPGRALPTIVSWSD